MGIAIRFPPDMDDKSIQLVNSKGQIIKQAIFDDLEDRKVFSGFKQLLRELLDTAYSQGREDLRIDLRESLGLEDLK